MRRKQPCFLHYFGGVDFQGEETEVGSETGMSGLLHGLKDDCIGGEKERVETATDTEQGIASSSRASKFTLFYL